MSLEITGPMLFFGGPYSNLEALTAIRSVAKTLSIEADHCLCSGDVIAYCADPKACIDEIRDWGAPVVMGNCEESLGFGADDCGCGFVEGTSCDLLSKQWFDYASKKITDIDRAWMRNLPRSIKLKYDNLTFLAIHGGVNLINRFLFASQEDLLREELNYVHADIIMGGHCGLPFAKSLNGKLWVNSGVIGMPANDRQTTTWYCLIEPGSGAIEVSFHKLDYDHQRASRKMLENGLDKGYADALVTGMWPNHDVLPDYEKQHTGQILDLPAIYFDGAQRHGLLKMQS